jgi:hypothetical protein
VDPFFGGFSGSVPSYGDIGPGYTGDFFNAPSPTANIGSSILQGLGRGILGGLSGLGRDSTGSQPGYSRSGSYADQTRDNMNSLLALALRSFETPESVI